MAHRQLAEDYRLKLKHANDRVFELESAIADQSYALEQLKSAEAPSAFTEQLESAHARIVELEETVTDLERRLKEALQEQTSSTALLQGCEADPMRGTDLVEQDFEAENKRSEELEEQLPDRDDEALCMDVDTATGAVRDAGPEISALREQVEMLKNHAAALEARLEEQNTTVTATTDAGQVVGSLRTQTLDLKNQLETYKTAETALRDQLARIGGKDAADASALQITANNLREKADKAVKRFERIEARLEARDRYVQTLKAQLAREKEARIKAESEKRGCSSKVCQFCKTCNAITIDLCHDEDDEENKKRLASSPTQLDSHSSLNGPVSGSLTASPM